MLRTACPVCNAPVETRDLASDPYFPFCGRRCKYVDLGKWLDGAYFLSEPLDEEDDE